jgi:hypothetical protein
MKWLFRPALWIGLSVALVGAAVLVFRNSSTLPQPLRVRDGEAEIVWLYPATSASNWERFVAAAKRSQARLQGEFPGLVVQDDAAFPTQTAEVPQVVFSFPNGARLIFRWYKVSGDRHVNYWVRSLLERQPPPLAIIGGGTSYWARELAIQLRNAPDKLERELADADRPVLALTTATADRVVLPEPPIDGEDLYAALREPHPDDTQERPLRRPLHQLYPNRTFRFAFTNRQMATAITRFLWDRDDLRPDRDPVYMVQWLDDGYSRDLVDGYEVALRRRVLDTWLQQWAWVSGGIAQAAAWPGWAFGLAGAPMPRHVLGRHGTNFRMEPWPRWIDSSIGSFSTPNKFEGDAAGELADRIQAESWRVHRPLLVVSGQAPPSRRFLHALATSRERDTVRRCIVATGDAISFNTIYRDRKVTWRIQDLPFRLVFFCHQSPVDKEAGFRALAPSQEGEAGEAALDSATGTEDLLLFGEIAESLALAWCEKGQTCSSAGELARRLLEARPRHLPVPGETRMFRPDGQRLSGTGEHVVYLRPLFEGDRVLPEAIIEVWAFRLGEGGERTWHRSGEPLRASYD